MTVIYVQVHPVYNIHYSIWRNFNGITSIQNTNKNTYNRKSVFIVCLTLSEIELWELISV